MRTRLKFALVLTPAIAILASGCANRHSVTVGATPDDYRTNHPIMISEKEQVLDLPVGRSDRSATKAQIATLEGFLSSYDRQAAPVVTFLSPSGSVNAYAAGQVARQLADVARKNGVPAGRVIMSTYNAGAVDVAAPVRVSFVGVKAHTDKCGRWPDDIAGDQRNKHYANFGCAYQSNLAAQIANPTDLLGPRKQSPIDAERRGTVLGDWREGGAEEGFRPETEINF